MAVTYEVVTELVEAEEVPEKLPESLWHSEQVDDLKGTLKVHLVSKPEAVVMRDIYLQHKGKRYAPDLSVILSAFSREQVGATYRVPEDGPPPDVVIEVAVSPKSLGEALSEKADFYAELQVKEYLVVEAFPEKPARLWLARPTLGERPAPVSEARLETLGIIVRPEGQKIRLFDLEGNEILSPSEAVERERAKRQELEQKVAELERMLAQQKATQTVGD